jgi:hypothetical protein
VVGDEVRQKLIRQFSIHSQAFEKYNGKWIADLGQMVEERLQLAGVTDVQRSEICTSKNPSAFFSYRRDGLCGRMASLIWLD